MTIDAQRLYMVIYSAPGLTPAGLLRSSYGRLARLSADTAVDDVCRAIAELERSAFAFSDEDTEEILLRRLTPILGYKQAQYLFQSAARIESLRLRGHAMEMFAAVGHDGRPATSDRRPGYVDARLTVYGRDGYRCRQCGWMPEVPTGYDGRYALGSVMYDAVTGEYRIRILELDHVYPRSLGGKFEISNLQTLCNSCNASKGARA